MKKNQFIIFEKDSNRFLMFDLISYIPLGDKPFYDFKLIPQLEKSSINDRKFNRLNNSEYIVLSLIRNILETKSFNKELDFLKEIVVEEKIKEILEENSTDIHFDWNNKSEVKIFDGRNLLKNSYYRIG